MSNKKPTKEHIDIQLNNVEETRIRKQIDLSKGLLKLNLIVPEELYEREYSLAVQETHYLEARQTYFNNYFAMKDNVPKGIFISLHEVFDTDLYEKLRKQTKLYVGLTMSDDEREAFRAKLEMIESISKVLRNEMKRSITFL